MDLPEPIRRRLGDFSRTVFVNQSQSQLSPEDHITFLNHNTDVVSSLPLQMALFFNMCFFPLWWISEVVMLQLKVPELAGFWLLSLLLQFPLILFQLFNEAILIQPLERGVHIVLALFILTEAVSGFVALRAMVRHTESRFHLSQFNGIQDHRS
ncbi:transmembrane protein 17B isoform X2 [Ictalurus furcatus]|uniref:transmembrane protein 17B isoform X2 n=1 Tax=Ictalurus furcatus TaxID=66913 RepID=UPI00235018AF|nr:transmembrane protein 17B isoform X2 [Ictalurus furcatus]